jgi:hypothetical protein
VKTFEYKYIWWVQKAYKTLIELSAKISLLFCQLG